MPDTTSRAPADPDVPPPGTIDHVPPGAEPAPPPGSAGGGVTPKAVSVCGVPTANLRQSRQADQAADVGRRRTPGAQFAQAGGGRRLRELSPRSIENEAVVTVGRLRQAKQLLQ